MRVLVYCYGSRGDVQPYLALATALNAAGHHAVLAAPAMFAPFAAEYGVDFSPRNDEWLRLLGRPEIRDLIANEDDRSSRFDAARALLGAEAARLYPVMVRDNWTAARHDVDLVVHQHNALDHGHQVAERLGVPAVVATLYPSYVPTWEYPSTMIKPGVRLPRLLNRLSYLPLGRVVAHRDVLDAWRTDTLGLPPRRGRFDRLRRPDGGRVPVLNGFSRHLVRPASDWPSSVHTTGFWFLPAPASWSPPPELLAFLDAGPPPVFVGFGSMAGRDPAGTGRLVAEAVRAAGVRAIVGTGWGGIELADHGPEILVLEQAPYDWLFPRVAAVVHAGGIGTIHAATVAGRPQVVIPFQREQMMWSRRTADLGLAPEPTFQRDLTVDLLTLAIRRATEDPTIATTAARLSTLMRTENGTASAVRLLAGV